MTRDAKDNLSLALIAAIALFELLAYLRDRRIDARTSSGVSGQV